MKENIRNDHIYIQLMKQHMTKNEHITRYLLKTIFLENYNANFCIFAPEGPRERNYTPKCSQWPHLYTTYFSQNQKGFGCIVAAVLLILSSKELI